MNVYVETNFVLELVFEQEQHASCEQIIALCESGKIDLILPAYCLAEPHEKLMRQARNRRELQQALDAELLQLARTKSNTTRITSIEDTANLLVQSTQEEKKRFDYYRELPLTVAQIEPLTQNIIVAAAYYEMPYGLSPQDALVYATVATRLRTQKQSPSCFLNRNAKDFDTPDIVEELAKNGCKMIPRFDHGYSFIEARLAS